MSALPRYYDRDLALVGLSALIGFVVALLPLPSSLQTIVLLPLALAVPGYALTAAVFPPRYITVGERVVLTVAFGIAVWSLGSLLLQTVFGLDRGLWLALFLVVALVCCVVAQSRREVTPTGPEPLQRDVVWPSPMAIAGSVLAVAISAAALAVASGGAERQLNRSNFSVLWMTVPDSGPTRPHNRAFVGVQNHEGRDLTYRLRVSLGGETLWRRSFRLAMNRERQFRAQVPGRSSGRLVAALFRDGTLYRRVALEVAAP